MESSPRRLASSVAVVGVTVLGLAVLGSACNSDDNETSAAGSSLSTTTAPDSESTTSSTAAVVNRGTEIEVTEFAFEPQTPTIAAGESVTWVNGGSARHTVTATPDATGASLFKSAPIQPEQSFVQTFNEPGSYTYFCSIHPEKMQGTIVVQ